MSLFPSARATSEVVEADNDSNLNWLHNASYKGQKGDRSGRTGNVVLFKEERCQPEKNEGTAFKKETVETESSYIGSHQSKHRKRTHSPDDSSSKSGVRKKAESKNKKHKKHHKKHEGEKSSRHKHVERKYRSKSRSPTETTQFKRPSSVWLDDQKSISDSLFFIDEKPDRDNLSMESLHFKDAAFYKRLGKTCLGGSEIYWSDRQKEKGQSKQWKKDRYFNPSSSVNLNQETVDMSKVKNDLNSETEKVSGFTTHVEAKKTKVAEFIPVKTISTKSSLKSSEVDPLGLYDDATKKYLGLHAGGEGKKLDNADTFNTEAQNTLRNPLIERVASYNRHLSENPSDTAKWIEFIHFQGELLDFFTSATSNQENFKSQERLLVERKLSILTRALEKNPDSLELRLEQVELCKNHWEHKKVDELWEKMLKDHSKNVDFWKHYLLYSQSAYSSFSVSKISTLYGECIQSFQDTLNKDSCNANIVQELFELFVQLCHFWHQAGHTEKAVAAFQAMIELNLFCPTNLEDSTSLSAQIAFLETFWDADVPKFGETGAQGWDKWMLFKERGGWEQTNPRENTDNDDEEHSIKSPCRGHSWVMEETWRSRSQFLPWHPDVSKGQTTDYCEDPDRLVIFDDISKVLFKLNTPDLKFQLVLRFLELLGVSVEAPSTTNSLHSHRFCHTVLQSIAQLSCSKFAVNVGESSPSQDEYSLLSSWHSLWQRVCPGVNRGFSPVSDAACSKYEDMILPHLQEVEGDFQAISKFIDNILEQLLPKFDSEQQSCLRILNFRFHLTKMKLSKVTKRRKSQIKHVQKIAKKYLSMESNRNDLSLWEIYALWEWGVGNHKESQRILETALSFAGVPKRESETHRYTRVIHTYATLKLQLVLKTKGRRSQTQIDQSEEDKCQLLTKEVINALATLGEGVKFIPLSQYPESLVSSGRILKARKRFVELLDECKMEYSPIVGPSPTPEIKVDASPSGSYLYHLSCCYALFQYLTVSLQGASVAFQNAISFIEKVPSDSGKMSSQKHLDHELLTVSHIQILSYHTAVNPVSVACLRSMLKRALLKYPCNSTLLEVLIQTESKSYVMGRLRRHFDHVTETSKSPLPTFFAIISEIRRQETIKEATKERSMTFDIKDTVISETGISHRIRSLFERAVTSRHTRHCILFWRMFLDFEVTNGNMKRAKSIFYRSLQNCPWAKVIYMDMIRYYPTEEELIEEMIDLMTEKEIHIRCPLEELDMIVTN